MIRTERQMYADIKVYNGMMQSFTMWPGMWKSLTITVQDVQLSDLCCFCRQLNGLVKRTTTIIHHSMFILSLAGTVKLNRTKRNQKSAEHKKLLA